MSFISSTIALSMIILTDGQESSPKQIEVSSVLITVIEQVEVSSRERGLLTSINVEEGNLVENGDLLAKIDDGDLHLALKRAQIELDSARALAENTVSIRLAKKTLELAESELERGEKSRKRFENAITDEEIERRVLSVDKAKLEVEQAEHERVIAQNNMRFSENEVNLAERQLEICRIVAPLSGIVVQVNRRAGEWVEPGEAVMRVLRIDRLRAEGFLDADQLQSVEVGQTIKLKLNSPGEEQQEFAGVLKFVSPEINPVDGRTRVWAEVENRDLLLRPGMRASMTVDVLSDLQQ